MLCFGITGGIGCGKTMVSEGLRRRGVLVIDADSLAKELTNTLPEIREKLVAAFGPDVYLSDGSLNRERLSSLVFRDPEARERINAIIHPAVQHEVERRFQEAADRGAPIAGVEAALIYESGMDRTLDVVVVVTAPLERRIKWLRKRDGLSRQKVLQRMNAQMPLEEKEARADYVVRNDGSLQDLEVRIAELHQWLLQRAG